ncbi:MAG: hypothetical protein ACRC1H_14400, partial [Caldilineaceae bacterium]
NDRNERLYLAFPGGGFSDEVGWEVAPEDGLALSWEGGASGAPVVASPGNANGEPVATGLAPVPEAASLPVAPSLPPPSLPAVGATMEDRAGNDGNGASIQLASAEASAPAALDASALALSSSEIGQRTLALVRSLAVGEQVTLTGRVTAPPGLINGTIYLADEQGNGVRIYLPLEDFPPLALGDLVRVSGRTAIFRGEVEVQPNSAAAVVRVAGGAVPVAVAAAPAQVGEGLEGRLVTVTGAVARRDDDSLYLADLHAPTAPPLRVVVLRSLGWALPAAASGEVWQATGIVGQLEGRTPGGGYRLVVRFAGDLVRVPVP